MESPRDRSHLVKQREIRFWPVHPDPQQAVTAMEFISAVDGVLEAKALEPALLRVRYDLTVTTLEALEAALLELGFHLDGSLLLRLRRALVYYTEENERISLGLETDAGASTRIFIEHYNRRRHGCRDDRPQHWRSYL